MTTTNEIQRLQIVLQADERLLLHIVLASDGTVQRLGSGRLDNDEFALVSGVTDKTIFDEVLQSLPDEFLESEGSYSDPNLRGQRLGLNITLMVNGSEHGFQMVYGSESEGPPDDVVAFVVAAKNLTESWYQRLK
jgi:hypothetical protein